MLNMGFVVKVTKLNGSLHREVYSNGTIVACVDDLDVLIAACVAALDEVIARQTYPLIPSNALPADTRIINPGTKGIGLLTTLGNMPSCIRIETEAKQ